MRATDPDVHLPSQRQPLVRRVELLARLDAAPAGSLILVVAPGGYGKSTVLGEWVSRLGAPSAWVRAEPADDDPSHLAARIALALRTALPLEVPVQAFPAGIVAGSRLDPAELLNAVAVLRRGRRSVALVVDDLHAITAPAAHALLHRLIDEGGPAIRVATAGRTRPDPAFSDLVPPGRCLELGPADLAFSEAETRRLLAATGQAVAADVAREVVRRTEGWPAGVYLAALAARQAPRDARSPVRPGAISGDDVYIADHFREEVLAAEPPDTVRFLLRTAVLDRMCGPLCDAVLQTTGSSARLLEARRRSLFVVPVASREVADAGDGPWLRYHRLFREMLLAELRLREPGEEPRLHRRAAAWFEAHGLLDEAIPHALAAGDPPYAARLVDLRAQEAFAEGRRTTVLGWLGRLDEAAFAAYPPLAVTAGWIWALSGQPIPAQTALRVARAAGPGSPLEPAVALLAAFVAPRGVEQMVDDARRAVELEPEGTAQRPVALALLGVAHSLAGHPELARPVLREAVALGLGQQRRTAAFASAQLALLALWAGEERGDAEIAASLALVKETGLEREVEAVLTHAVAAWGAARDGDLAAMRRHVAAVELVTAEASPGKVAWYGTQVSVVLGRAALEAGDPLTARVRLDEARHHLGQLLTEGVLRAQVDELAGLLARASAGGGRPVPVALTAAEVRVLQLLPTHLSLREIAEELDVSRNTVKTQVAATYRKLQAANRAEAVRRGRELSLLT